MTRNQTFFSAAIVASLSVLTVAGCGGGDGEIEPSPTPAPTVAPSPTPTPPIPGEIDFPLPDDLPRPPTLP